MPGKEVMFMFPVTIPAFGETTYTDHQENNPGRVVLIENAASTLRTTDSNTENFVIWRAFIDHWRCNHRSAPELIIENLAEVRVLGRDRYVHH